MTESASPLDAWRAADLALREARRLVEAETLRVAREGREVYRRHASPARRDRLLPVPDDLLSGRVGPHVLEGQWSDLLTPAEQRAVWHDTGRAVFVKGGHKAARRRG